LSKEVKIGLKKKLLKLNGYEKNSQILLGSFIVVFFGDIL